MQRQSHIFKFHVYLISYTRLFAKLNLSEILLHGTFNTIKISRSMIYCKLLKVEKFCCCRTKFKFAAKHSWLHSCDQILFHSVIAMSISQCYHYFTEKALQLPINPRKSQNFYTLDNLQYVVYMHASLCTFTTIKILIITPFPITLTTPIANNN